MFPDLVRRKWLADVAPRPQRQRLYHMRFAALGSNHDHRRSLGVLDACQCFYELQSIHDRHVDVTKDQLHRFSASTANPSAPLPASNTLLSSIPAWRSDRSTIFRITEESSTIRACMLFMTSYSFSLRGPRVVFCRALWDISATRDWTLGQPDRGNQRSSRVERKRFWFQNGNRRCA